MQEKVKKVKAEIVLPEKEKPKENGFFKKVKNFLIKIKIGIAIILDIVDFLIGWVPIVNTAWDIATFIILLIILKNKKLAFLSLIELPFIGLPPFSIIDMFIPVATITVLIDTAEKRMFDYSVVKQR